MRRETKALGFKIALGLFVVLGWVCFRTYHPPFPNPMEMELTLGSSRPGAKYPLITSGVPGMAEFLFIGWDQAGRIQFGYDRWSRPEVRSEPLTLEPHSVHRLVIWFPGLALQDGNTDPVSSRIRVVCDGRDVFDPTAYPVLRNHRQIYFGTNPVGGTTCGPSLDGTLRDAAGRILRGYPSAYFSWKERLAGWLTYGRWNALLTLVLSLAGGWLAAALIRWWPGWAAVGLKAKVLLWRHRWFLVGLAAGVGAFGWLITAGTGTLFFPEIFGNFYDYQARSFLGGHLDVPPEGIDAEAFIFHGRSFGYFGSFPALLRVPLVIYDLKF